MTAAERLADSHRAFVNGRPSAPPSSSRPAGGQVSQTFRRPPSWASLSACLSADPDLFFAETEAEIAEAKAVCAGCQVASLCLDAALARGEAYGVYGGKDAAERRRIADGSDEVHRPSAAGAWQHSTAAGYQAHGCRCARCREAHAARMAHWRAQRKWRSLATTSPTLLVVVNELHVPAGRGRVRAFPGQLFIALEAAA